jgi:hypothetical protein
VARRKRKEEEPEWTPPEFDEVGYMRKEIESAQVALVIIAWSAVGAGLAYVLSIFVHPAAGFLLGLAAFAPLYFLLPALRLPVATFKRRDWFGHASIYFFCWLAFFILLLNPPFGDHTPPTIQFVAVGSYPSTNLSDPAAHSIPCTLVTGASVSVPTNNTFYVIFRATDNVAVSNVTVQVTQQTTTTPTPDLIQGRLSVCSDSPVGTENLPGTYAVKVPVSGSQITVTVSTRDGAGLTTTAAISILPVQT